MSEKLEERVAKLEAEVKRLKGNCIKKINKKLSIGDTFELVDLIKVIKILRGLDYQRHNSY